MIDTSKWKKFRVGTLFDIHPTKAYKMNNNELLSDDGVNPVVVNSGFNNGIGGFTNFDCTEKSGIITFTDTAAKSSDSFFYQTNDFVGYPHVQGMYMKNHTLTANEGRFISTVLRSTVGKYDYITKMTRDEVADLFIKLPVAKDGQPDWNYMNSFMEQIIVDSEKKIDKFIKTDGTKHQIDVSEWKKFHLYEGLFNIDPGTKLDKVKMTERNPTINFVGRANTNNGITACVDAVNGLKPYKAGYMTLSLGGEYLGSCFIQPKPFYTSQNVIVLIPAVDMTDNIKRFIATVIFKESRLHYKAFVDELNRHIKTDFSIPLPITSSGTPNWEYMENYMKQIMDKSERIISDLQIGM